MLSGCSDNSWLAVYSNGVKIKLYGAPAYYTDECASSTYKVMGYREDTVEALFRDGHELIYFEHGGKRVEICNGRKTHSGNQ